MPNTAGSRRLPNRALEAGRAGNAGGKSEGFLISSLRWRDSSISSNELRTTEGEETDIIFPKFITTRIKTLIQITSKIQDFQNPCSKNIKFKFHPIHTKKKSKLCQKEALTLTIWGQITIRNVRKT
ncbi:hypothetical protein Hanom_Chr04g00330451 [Helianthus anomalus]